MNRNCVGLWQQSGQWDGFMLQGMSGKASRVKPFARYIMLVVAIPTAERQTTTLAGTM